MTYTHPQPDFVKNARDEVINLQGELGNPAQHADSPKTADTSASAIALTSGKRSMRITNIGDEDVYYGDSTVTSANGDVIFSNGESILFENCKNDFTLYVLTAANTSELRIICF